MPPEKLLKAMCKTCLNSEAILDGSWLHFEGPFRLRMGGDFKNFRSWRSSFPRVLEVGFGKILVGCHFGHCSCSFKLVAWRSFLTTSIVMMAYASGFIDRALFAEITCAASLEVANKVQMLLSTV